MMTIYFLLLISSQSNPRLSKMNKKCKLMFFRWFLIRIKFVLKKFCRARGSYIIPLYIRYGFIWIFSNIHITVQNRKYINQIKVFNKLFYSGIEIKSNKKYTFLYITNRLIFISCFKFCFCMQYSVNILMKRAHV